MQIRLFCSRLVLPNLGTLGGRCREGLASGGPFVAMWAAALSYSTKYTITRDDTELCSVQGPRRSLLRHAFICVEGGGEAEHREVSNRRAAQSQ